MQYFGYEGKILCVDLTSRQRTEKPLYMDIAKRQILVGSG